MLMENFLRSKEYWYVVETEISAAVDNVDLLDEQRKEVADQRLKDYEQKIISSKPSIVQSLRRSWTKRPQREYGIL